MGLLRIKCNYSEGKIRTYLRSMKPRLKQNYNLVKLIIS